MSTVHIDPDNTRQVDTLAHLIAQQVAPGETPTNRHLAAALAAYPGHIDPRHIDPPVEIHIHADQPPPHWYRPRYDTLVRHHEPDPALWHKIPHPPEADTVMLDPYDTRQEP